MRLKKTNALLGLLSAFALALHMGYIIYAYLSYDYQPTVILLTSIPFTVVCCLHAVCGMSSVFLLADGTSLLLYPKQNRITLIQRCSAALFFPLLILHMNTFRLLSSCAENGQWFFFSLLILSQPLFYAVALTHTTVSVSKALITLGLLSNRKQQKRMDTFVYIIGAIFFVLTVYAVISAELAMLLQTGGQP